MNYIKLLSVLLCIVVLFAACGPKDNDVEDGTSDGSDTGSSAGDEAPYTPVDPVLANFFNFEYEQPWKVLSEALRIDGEIVSRSADGKVFVLRSVDIDAMNMVTETFTVYNSELGKAVLSLNNTYEKGTSFDWVDFEVSGENDPWYYNYPSNAMRVTLENVIVDAYDGNGFAMLEATYVKVSKASFKAIDKDVREENEKGDCYDVTTSYEYYDIAGQKITDSKSELYVSEWTDKNADGTFSLSFGSDEAIFDLDTMKLVSLTSEETQKLVGPYDFETDKYGYALYMWDYQPLENGIYYLDVIDKATNEIKYRHYYSVDAEHTAFVLDNGDVLIQETRTLPYDTKKTPDYTNEYGDKKTVNTFVLDITTGDVNEIEFNYVVSALMQNEEIEDTYSLDEIGVTITDNALNIAIVSAIKDGSLDKAQIVVYNNDLDVIFELDRVIPEHKFSVEESFGMKVLPSGDYLVSIYNQADEMGISPTSNYAIVTKDGVVRCYLPTGAKVVGEYVVIENKGIYDYDFNCVFEFADVDDGEQAYQFVTFVGGKIIISQNEKRIDRDSFTPETVTQYYSVEKGEDGLEKEKWIDGATLVATKDDFVIMCDADNGKYTLYNAELKQILTTQQEMTVYACEDGNYVVYTTVNTIDGSDEILYVVK